jgi:hypothetical protein
MATNNLITLPLAITPEATTLNDEHYLGHRNLQSAARYTALAPDRFAKFWRD